MKRKSQKELRRGLTDYLASYAGRHPLDVLLDSYERQARGLLADDQARGKAERVLWCIERVREKTEKKDAKGAALYTYRLAVAINKAKLMLIAPKGGSHSKSKEGIELAIIESLRENPARTAWDIWWTFQKHDIVNPLHIGIYEVYLDDETQRLIQDEDLGITRRTFDNYVTRIRNSLK
jgi:hypothetical protein